MLSPIGRCKTLDASADGYGRAEAVGVYLLQSLNVPGTLAPVRDDKAHCDGNGQGSSAVLAILSGSAVNQDGRSSSLTAPNGPTQQMVISSALAAAGLSSESMAGVSMHGTGKPQCCEG
jgi:acyl transferase domain-containing protein